MVIRCLPFGRPWDETVICPRREPVHPRAGTEPKLSVTCDIITKRHHQASFRQDCPRLSTPGPAIHVFLRKRIGKQGVDGRNRSPHEVAECIDNTAIRSNRHRRNLTMFRYAKPLVQPVISGCKAEEK
jgi:hypothetical protein